MRGMAWWQNFLVGPSPPITATLHLFLQSVFVLLVVFLVVLFTATAYKYIEN